MKFWLKGAVKTDKLKKAVDKGRDFVECRQTVKMKINKKEKKYES